MSQLQYSNASQALAFTAGLGLILPDNKEPPKSQYSHKGPLHLLHAPIPFLEAVQESLSLGELWCLYTYEKMHVYSKVHYFSRT